MLPDRHADEPIDLPIRRGDLRFVYRLLVWHFRGGELLGKCAGSSNLTRPIVEYHDLMCMEGQGGVGSAVVVRELHFDRIGSEEFNDGPYLAAAQGTLGNVFR